MHAQEKTYAVKQYAETKVQLHMDAKSQDESEVSLISHVQREEYAVFHWRTYVTQCMCCMASKFDNSTDDEELNHLSGYDYEMEEEGMSSSSRSRKECCHRSSNGQLCCCLGMQLKSCRRSMRHRKRRFQRCMNDAFSSSSVLGFILFCMMVVLVCFIVGATVQWTVASSSVDGSLRGHVEDSDEMDNATAGVHNSSMNASEWGNSSHASERNGIVLFEGVKPSVQEQSALERLEQRFLGSNR